MNDKNKIPFHQTTAAQFIRMLLEMFHSLLVAALYGVAAVGAFVSYLLLGGKETVELPSIPMNDPFSHGLALVFVIGALVGVAFNLANGGFFRRGRSVVIERHAITVPLGGRKD
ncbi:hypothetical protein STENOSP10_29960 [Stenotrophomonas sepilia]|uniref:Transmembrane protein n=1 Tax=Stenotrophomonas sepilia TaxID=2860290 RepID=A0ABQ6QFD7_9GAMM|nr:hypothetical protein STENOSP10_29960 [Stenotrophomonas sepilia]